MNNEILAPKTEEIEGLGGDEDAFWIDYPIDTLLIRNENRTVHDVLRRIEKGAFIMDPDFQRDFIWKDDQQSKLIESVLMRIPLPVFYLAEDERGRMIVVDGLQRLSTFKRFVENDLYLKLPERSELDKKRFTDLSPKLQNRVEDCNLVLYIIDAKVPERARLDIFERVNSGVPLTRQQMRNSLYMGPATLFLKEEASTEIFLKATGESLNTRTMRDREFVNRFCAFQILERKKYKGDMDEFLAEALVTINKLESQALKDLSRQFRNGLFNNYEIFQEHAFRKWVIGQTRRSVINASLWDVMSTGLSIYSKEIVITHGNELKEAFSDLLKNELFISAITSGTNDTRKVNCRFEEAEKKIREVLGD
ncbi:MAG: DUF262 domain-containing protein [Deltaproteobacteria bacterium]|nr:DUF262 domain-containing protein [Deltaproteobacteria bacterium]